MADKKRILFLCSLPKDANVLRFIDEIGEIEDRLLTGQNRNEFDFLPKLAIKPGNLRQVVTGTPGATPPFIIHFSMHGDKANGLVFSDAKGEEAFQSAEYFLQLFDTVVNGFDVKVEGLIFNVCHSLVFAEDLKRFVKFSVGVNDFIPDDASIAFSKGFYGSLFDGWDEKKAFAAGQDAIMEWKAANNIEETDGGILYEKRFQLFN